MAAFFSDNVLDSGLNYLDTNGGALYICSAQPTTYTEATATFALGNKTPPAIAAPADRTGGGRQCTVSAITDGTVTATGTASHYAIVKTTATTELLITQALAATQAVTSGNSFTLTAIEIGIPDPSA